MKWRFGGIFYVVYTARLKGFCTCLNYEVIFVQNWYKISIFTVKFVKSWKSLGHAVVRSGT